MSPGYALLTCPHYEEKCGKKQVFTFDTVGSSDNATVKNLKKGDSCTFEIKANCGGPAFEISTTSTMKGDVIGIAYIEYNSQRYDQWRDIPLTFNMFHPNISSRHNETYMEGMPARSLYFSQSRR
jgi:hypothetical protein